MEDSNDPYAFDTDSSASGLRRTWDPHSTKAMEERLEKFEKMPRMGQMMRMFSGDNVLSHVLRREGKDRCYESRTSSEKDRGSE